MKKVLLWATGIICTLFILCLVGYLILQTHLFLSLAITFGTIAYHFLMRLFVGVSINAICRNRVNPYAKWFRMQPFEQKCYRFLRVRKWKRLVIAYNPADFSLKNHTPYELAGAMCQAEIVHECIIPLAFLPIAAIPFCGAAPVFIITSILSAGLDAIPVIVQRFNRPRILRLIKTEENHEKQR